jgi:hypothetical protein
MYSFVCCDANGMTQGTYISIGSNADSGMSQSISGFLTKLRATEYSWACEGYSASGTKSMNTTNVGDFLQVSTCQTDYFLSGVYYTSRSVNGYTVVSFYAICSPPTVLCPAGSYLPMPNKSAGADGGAIKCNAGTYSTAIGASSSSTCVACASGKYSTAVGASTPSTCIACPSGKYSSESGASMCSDCSSGANAGGTNPDCSSCPLNFDCSNGQISTCNSGFFFLERPSDPPLCCLICPSGFYNIDGSSTFMGSCTQYTNQ